MLQENDKSGGLFEAERFATVDHKIELIFTTLFYGRALILSHGETACSRECQLTRMKPVIVSPSRDIDEVQLPVGDATVKLEWSALNYRDSLAISSKSPVARRFPMVPGIDFAGTVTASRHPDKRAIRLY